MNYKEFLSFSLLNNPLSLKAVLRLLQLRNKSRYRIMSSVIRVMQYAQSSTLRLFRNALRSNSMNCYQKLSFFVSFYDQKLFKVNNLFSFYCFTPWKYQEQRVKSTLV